ncbi:MAG TPA: transposase [Terriglobia bacterium]|nr:transposase [Terriglobia bacterium]
MQLAPPEKLPALPGDIYCEGGDDLEDNNGVKRSLRGVAVCRKNWMFLGSDNGGHIAVVLSSRIATSL